MELTALALRSAAQKLRPYFQAHPVVVLTDQPLRNILHKPDLTGRMLQWAIELSEFGIEFQPRLSMKGQVMADFVLEYSESLANARNQVKKSGGLCELMEPHDHPDMRPSYPDWTSLALSVSKLRVYSDSQLVVRHVQKEYEPKDARMTRYLTKVRDTLQRFTEWTIEKIRRTENGCRRPGRHRCLPPHQRSHIVAYTCANQPFCRRNSTCNTIEASQADDQEWTNNITEYLGQALCPKIPASTQDPVQAARFTDWGALVQALFTGPYLRCLSHSEALYVLAEMHEGTLNRLRSMALRTMGHGHSGTLPATPAQKKFLLVATDYLVNGWKLKHMQASKTKMSPNSYGKTSSAALESLKPL
ncbi:hypothetical protein CK203_035733 [Vitis vinifera]|uniref:Reverse transcriptase RNase H-like domain-containing protein n=1 Tax=Vitis vinifera TaxID=29760 RepID=A0A438ICG1_VITVI|nr:hypothetical protein CK203_035733 [Vitis vinifera]